MKQIFDWLREQMQSNSNASEAEMYYMLDEDRGQCCLYSEIDLEEQKSKTWLDAKSLVNEAEAKWEAECCEWKQTGLSEPPRYFEAHDLMAYELDICLWKYCPICGKPIKISEVE